MWRKGGVTPGLEAPEPTLLPEWLHGLHCYNSLLLLGVSPLHNQHLEGKRAASLFLRRGAHHMSKAWFSECLLNEWLHASWINGESQGPSRPQRWRLALVSLDWRVMSTKCVLSWKTKFKSWIPLIPRTLSDLEDGVGVQRVSVLSCNRCKNKEATSPRFYIKTGKKLGFINKSSDVRKRRTTGDQEFKPLLFQMRKQIVERGWVPLIVTLTLVASHI